MELDDRALQEGLARVIPPALARFALGVASGETVATSDVLDQTMLARMLSPESRDRRAVVSVWALEAFETVLPPVVGAAVLLGRVPGVEVGWVVGKGGVTRVAGTVLGRGEFRRVRGEGVGTIRGDRGGAGRRVAAGAVE